jgi:hypothetical protein
MVCIPDIYSNVRPSHHSKNYQSNFLISLQKNNSTLSGIVGFNFYSKMLLIGIGKEFNLPPWDLLSLPQLLLPSNNKKNSVFSTYKLSLAKYDFITLF